MRLCRPRLSRSAASTNAWMPAASTPCADGVLRGRLTSARLRVRAPRVGQRDDPSRAGSDGRVEGGVCRPGGLEGSPASVDGREDPESVLADGDRVLPVSGPGAVEGHYGPVVGEHLGVGAAEGDHRLDGAGEAVDELGARLAHRVVGDLRVHVHLRADAVADVLVDDAVGAAVALGGGLDAGLDRVTDGVEATADLHGRYAGVEPGLGGV